MLATWHPFGVVEISLKGTNFAADQVIKLLTILSNNVLQFTVDNLQRHIPW